MAWFPSSQGQWWTPVVAGNSPGSLPCAGEVCIGVAVVNAAAGIRPTRLVAHATRNVIKRRLQQSLQRQLRMEAVEEDSAVGAVSAHPDNEVEQLQSVEGAAKGAGDGDRMLDTAPVTQAMARRIIARRRSKLLRASPL